MKKSKGFTLIELLAVIVVLAVIALIAVPIVLNLVNTAKKGAAEASAIAFVKEVDTYILLTQMNPELPKLENGETYQISRIKYEEVAFIDLFVDRVYAEENEEEIFLNEIIDMKGTKPTSGTVTIYGNKVSEAKLITNGYNVSCIGDTCEVKGKSNIKEEEKEPEVTYPNVLDTVKTLVYDENGTCKTGNSYMGGCYISGASTNNYVWYNGFIWRIMGINSDGTIRLITDENVTSMPYGPPNTGFDYRTIVGYMDDWFNDYFYVNLNDTKKFIQEGEYFCVYNTSIPTTTVGRPDCPDSAKFKAKVGTLSSDEYLLAGGASSYLKNGMYFKTITPNSSTYGVAITYKGETTADAVNNQKGIRPVINVAADTPVTAGSGSAQDFYVFGENKTGDIKGKIGDKASSGEYVKLEGRIYRVVRKTSEGVKLILDDFYRNSSNAIVQVAYGSNVFSTTSGIGQVLNNEVLTWLGLSNSNKVIETTYYQGESIASSVVYTKFLQETNGKKCKVGLIQANDILSGQSSTMLTKNYTTGSSHTNTQAYWTMNIKATTGQYLYSMTNMGWLGDTISYKTNAVRPVITIDSNLDIISGSGTWKNPYNV